MDAWQSKRSQLSAFVRPLSPVPKKELVPIFYKEQDDTWAKPARIVPRPEARLMKDAHLGKFENHGDTFRLNESTPAAIREFRPSEDPTTYQPSDFGSSAAISFAEMKANAGEVGTDIPHRDYIILCAQEKVRAYSDDGMIDLQSPLARGYWPVEQTQIAVESPPL